MKKAENIIGTVLASAIAVVLVFCWVHQFFSLSVGNMHSGGLYGGRGDFIMGDSY